MTLLFLAPLLWIAAAVPWVILHSTLGRRQRRTALVAGLVFTLCSPGSLSHGSECPTPTPPRFARAPSHPGGPSFIPA